MVKELKKVCDLKMKCMHDPNAVYLAQKINSIIDYIKGTDELGTIDKFQIVQKGSGFRAKPSNYIVTVFDKSGIAIAHYDLGSLIIGFLEATGFNIEEPKKRYFKDGTI